MQIDIQLATVMLWSHQMVSPKLRKLFIANFLIMQNVTHEGPLATPAFIQMAILVNIQNTDKAVVRKICKLLNSEVTFVFLILSFNINMTLLSI